MRRTYPKISYCIGVYNEEKHLKINLKKLTNGLNFILGKNNYEIVLVDNGSTDKTPLILQKMKNNLIHPYFVKKRAHGSALKTAIKKARFNHIVITAIDIPFGFADLKTALKLWGNYDIIFGSKAHQLSKINYDWKRKIASFIFRKLLNFFFNLKIQDSQGSIFLKRKKIVPILKYCHAENAFFTAQIAIYGQLFGLKMLEIPVSMRKNKEGRVSRYNILTDGFSLLLTLLQEYFK